MSFKKYPDPFLALYLSAESAYNFLHASQEQLLGCDTIEHQAAAL